jgi:tetratricopeptide (TPR) repeat protein
MRRHIWRRADRRLAGQSGPLNLLNLRAIGEWPAIAGNTLAAQRQAERLEPLAPAIACDFGFIFYWARRYKEAIEASRRALDLHPSFARTYVPLARAHAALRHYDEAIEICLEARPLFHGRAFLGHLLATLGYCYGLSGRPMESAAVIEADGPRTLRFPVRYRDNPGGHGQPQAGIGEPADGRRRACLLGDGAGIW